MDSLAPLLNKEREDMEQIKNRFTGEIMCGGLSLKIVLEKHQKWLNDDEGGERADLSRAYLIGANLSDVNLAYTDLSYTDLAGANLVRADLSYADLSYADLSYAVLAGANLVRADMAGGAEAYGYTFYKPPLQIEDKYKIEIWDGFMKIGCEKHTLAEWKKFKQKRIIEMDGKAAATWWKKWKPALFALAKAGDRMKLPE